MTKNSYLPNKTFTAQTIANSDFDIFA